VTECYNARQDNTVQYSTIPYTTLHYTTLRYNNTQHTSHKITHNTQDNPQYTKLQKNQKHTLYTIKTQKRVELKVDESVFKITGCTKQ
jgi:hypothetical protein